MLTPEDLASIRSQVDAVFAREKRRWKMPNVRPEDCDSLDEVLALFGHDDKQAAQRWVDHRVLRLLGMRWEPC